MAKPIGNKLRVYVASNSLTSYLNGQIVDGYMAYDKNSWSLEIFIEEIIEVDIPNNSVVFCISRLGFKR